MTSISRAGLKFIAGLSLAVVLATSNTANAQGVVTPTPTPSCTPNVFKANLMGSQEVPPNNSTATGTGVVELNRDPGGATIMVSVTFTGLSANATAAHIHGPAMPGVTAPVIIPFPNFPAATSGTYTNTFPITPEQMEWLLNGLLYINIHNENFPNGEIRGQLLGECEATPTPTASATPSASATATVSATPSTTGTPNFTSTPTPTATPTTSPSATITPSATPSATASGTPSPTPTFEGNFVIGDLDAVVGNEVTFFSPQWANINHLSGGTAPHSFKGFARFPDPNPAECGGTWTTTPGNSSHPPTDVPEFITAIAASSITKAGPIISGDIPMLVVIQTDEHNGNGLGNPRTGTVVSIICGGNATPTPGPSCTPNTFTTTLTGDQEVPPNDSSAMGKATVVINSDPAQTTITVDVSFTGLSANATVAHLHGPAMPGMTAPPIIPLTNFPATTSGTYSSTFPITEEQIQMLLDGLVYINIHDELFPDGEIRGQLIGCPAALLANISTRLQVDRGDNVLIGGLIITGNTPKNVLFRAVGPSLPMPDRLADPILELHNAAGQLLATNDNWRDAPNAQQIINTTIPPQNDLESAILMNLAPGAYTTIVRGANDSTGTAVVEAYDLDQGMNSHVKLANISTRGFVRTGDNVLIGGLIVHGHSPIDVIVRAIGPSVPVAGTLADPTLELRSSDGTLIAANDNWRSDQQAEIIDTGLAPSNNLESAIVRELAPGTYTAIVRGAHDTTGVALVEVYGLN